MSQTANGDPEATGTLHNGGSISHLIPAQGTNTNTQPAKRRKILLACNTCRDRKTRCDGRRPACSACIKKGIGAECVFEETSLKNQRFVSTLEGRVKELEKWNGRRHDPIDGVQLFLSRMEQNQHPYVQRSIEYQPNQQHRVVALRANEQSRDDGGAGNARLLTTLPSNEEHAECLFGESSSIAFVDRIMESASPNQPLSNPPKEPATLFSSSQIRQPVQFTDIDDFFLPRRRVADNHLNCFWEYVHPIYPIIYKTGFLRRYEKLWQPETHRVAELGIPDDRDPVYLATLSIMLAIGCQFSDFIEPARRPIIADQFYQQSKRLLPADFMDYTSLPSLQLLLVTGVYLLGTTHTGRCWNIVGLALRVAQGLGLQLDSVRPQSNCQLKRELRRRVWYSCVILDRVLAVSLGRQSMILPGSSVPLPQMIDDEYLLDEGEGCQPPQLRSFIEGFVYSIRLFDILHDVLIACYSPSIGGDVLDKQLSTVMRINSDLDRFLQDLPPHLSVEKRPEDSQDNSFSLYCNILNYRLLPHLDFALVLYIRALLLRPILLSTLKEMSNNTKATSNGGKQDLNLKFALHVCRLCVETVQALVAQLHANVQDKYGCWKLHVVHYTFTSGIILIAANACSLRGVEFEKSPIETSWSRCISILKFYTPQFPSASRAIDVLQKLQERIIGSRTDIATNAVERDSSEIGAQGAPRDESNANWHLADDVDSYDSLGLNALGSDWFEDQVVDFDWLQS
ncbi:hypothetical protein DPV78_009209 [Talaromyces pinophilus]|nr:hypothetical protein DPV78_009209 [Talaromyces pinophilus]